MTGFPQVMIPHRVVMVSEENSSAGQSCQQVGVACANSLAVVSTAGEHAHLPGNISLTGHQILDQPETERKCRKSQWLHSIQF
jgi:hypothetical protein